MGQAAVFITVDCLALRTLEVTVASICVDVPKILLNY